MDDDRARAQDGPAPGDAEVGAGADDAAFARLRAADPAPEAAADLTAVLARVSAETGIALTGSGVTGAGVTDTGVIGTAGAGVAGDSPDGGAEETIPVDELTARRARRAPRWVQVAAVVAGIAVIGGGSYALGDARAGTTPAASPAMSLAGGPGRVGAAPEAAPNPAAMAAGSDAKIAGWGLGRTVFTSEGLSSAGGGTAQAYGFDAASTYSRATVERVAEALGVVGTPQQQYGQWTVGPNDGTAPTVSISPDGLTSVSYDDPTRNPWGCLGAGSAPIEPRAVDGSTGSAAAAGADGSAGSDAVAPPALPTPDVPVPAVPVPPGCPTSADRAPSGGDAVAEAEHTMSALGVDPAGYELEASTDSGNAPVTSVSAYQVVDGQRSGVSWSFSVVASGVQSLYGALAPTVPLGAYHVISPTDAVARLSDPRFGPTYGGVVPLAADARSGVGSATVGAPPGVGSATADVAPAPSDAPTVPATPTPGSPIAWPVQQVTIVSARLGLALATLPDGASVLVPTYELADADGTAWTVVAVADADLDFTG